MLKDNVRSIALLAAAFVTSPGVYAQSLNVDSLDSETPVCVIDKGPAGKVVEIRPYVAAGASTLMLNYEKVVPGATNVLTSPSVLWRTGVDVGFSLNKFLGLNTGLAFENAHNEYAMSIVDNATGSINSIFVNNRFSQLYVPVYLTWKLRMSHRLVLNIDTGWYLAFATGGRMAINGYSTGQNSLGQPVITPLRFETDYFNAKRALVNGIKDRDSGVRVAVGLTLFRHFSLKSVLNFSVRNLAINHDVIDARYRNLNLAAEFGYCF